MNELTEILGKELETFNRFLFLLDEQHKQVVRRDLAGLGNTNSELDLLCNQASELERARQSIVQSISNQMNIESTNLRLSDLLERLDQISSNRLNALRQAILDVHQKIEEKSIRNRFLIDKSRNLIAESMKILANRPSPVYQRPQSDKTKPPLSKLVNWSA
jgi:hypothetical protein